MKNNSTYKILLIVAATIAIAIGISLITSFYTTKTILQKGKATPQSIHLAIVDISKVKDQSLPFKNFKELIETKHAKFHKEILELEIQLRNQYDVFKKNEEKAKETNQGPSAELVKQKEDFEKRVTELEHMVRERQEELNREFTDLSQKIEEILKQTLINIANEQNFNLIINTAVMDSAVVLYGNEGLDITGEIIRRLDEKLASINLPTA